MTISLQYVEISGVIISLNRQTFSSKTNLIFFNRWRTEIYSTIRRVGQDCESLCRTRQQTLGAVHITFVWK